MASVVPNHTVTFHGTLTVIAAGTVFQSLENEDLRVTTGYGISTSIARSNPLEAWADYLSGGNPNLSGQTEEPGGEDPSGKDDL